jgi:prepilin-type processing-associated H-X9-DG protein
MGVALQLYVHEHQNKYPHYLGPAGPSYGDAVGEGGRAIGLVYWSSKLYPYYSLNWSNTAFHCPGYKGKIKGPHIKGAIDRQGGYAYNAGGVGAQHTYDSLGVGPVLFWELGPGTYVPAVSESEVRVPSGMLAMGDSQMRSGEEGGSDFLRCGGYATPFPPIVLRHGKNYNILLCDGHVSGMSPDVLFNPTNSASLWNYDHQPHPELWTH